MLTLLDNAGTYTLPTGWHEVTTRQYCDLDRLQLATVESRASYFAGRPIQVNGLVADALAWMLQGPVPTDGGLPYPADLGQETYLQVETIRALLLTQPLHECYAEVFGTFVARRRGFQSPEFNQNSVASIGGQALTFPTTETYPAVAHCLAELQRLDAKYAVLAEPDYTEAARRAREAGSERLGIFGHFNVARHYAQALGITIDAAYQMPWETIALLMYQDRISAEIHDNLSRQASHD